MTLQKYILSLSVFLFFSIGVNAQEISAKSRTIATDSLKSENFRSYEIPLTDSIVNYGKIFLNTPYRRGSTGTNNFDCSGFTSFVYRNFGYNLKRSSSDQAGQFDPIDRHNLKTGDLVFFSGRRRSHSRVGHVGIVVDAKDDGNFNFIHASVHNGVIISNSQEDYYVKRYIKAGRVINNNQLLAVNTPSGHVEKTISDNTNLTNITPIASPSKQTLKKIPAEFYTVKKGETLSSISKKFGISIAELKRKNKLKGNKINLKQRLKIKDAESVMLVEAVQPTDENEEVASVDQPEIQPKKTEQKPTETKINSTHTVKRGETLFTISNQYKLTVDEIKKQNHLMSGNIRAGQKLLISTHEITTEKSNSNLISKKEIEQKEQAVMPENAPKTVTETQSKTVVHRVLSGESLFGLAKENNMTVAELKKLNHLSSNTLKAGQKIKITRKITSETPVVSPKETKNPTTETSGEQKENLPSKLKTHTIKKGETLIGIAKDNNLTVEELKKINKLEDTKIQYGQVLKLTDSKEPSVDVKPIKETAPKLSIYKVKSGDSYTTIAHKYRCTIADLKKWNQKTSNKLNAGDKLRIYQ